MRQAVDVLELVQSGTNIVVPLANGEPVTVLDAIEANSDRLYNVRVHQMHALKDRPMMAGVFGDRLRHVSYFLSHITRPHLQAGTIDFVPANFSEVPSLMRKLPNPLLLVSVSPMDRHGFFSLGTNCDYVASLVGRAPVFVEVNRQMPRTFGRTQIHVSQVAGWCEADYPLVAMDAAEPDPIERRIGELIAERIPNGATIQVGIGGIPNAVLAALRGHRNLGVHTELFSDGLMDLVDLGVVNGVNKRLDRTKSVATFCMGSEKLYKFLHENPAVELKPVRYVNDPRVIGQDPNFVSISATLEVDLFGQCASESIGSSMYSGSGGQADFARGAMYSEKGKAFLVLRSTTSKGRTRVLSQLTPGAVVTTIKNTVDHVVTEHGVAELRGQTMRERARRLIAIADPACREGLEADARRLGFI